MKTLKALALVAATAALTVGCTSIKTPAGWEYQSTIFQKQIEGIELTGSTNGAYSLKVRGYRSEAASIAEGVATGLAKGLKPVP
jgi:hypothetical protein